MVETIKTATAAEEGKGKGGAIMEATRAKTNIGNPQQGSEKRATVTSSMFYKGQAIRDSQVRD